MAHLMVVLALILITVSSFFLLGTSATRRRGSFGADNVAAVVGVAGVVLGIAVLVIGAAAL